MRCLRASIVGLTLALTGWMSGAAYEEGTDELMPKDYSVVDERGVDLAERTFTVSHSISIGDPQNGGLSYTLSHTSPGTWRAHQSVHAFVRVYTTTDPETGFVAENRTLRFMGRTEVLYGDGTSFSGELGSRVTWCGAVCVTAVLAMVRRSPSTARRYQRV